MFSPVTAEVQPLPVVTYYPSPRCLLAYSPNPIYFIFCQGHYHLIGDHDRLVRYICLRPSPTTLLAGTHLVSN